MLIKRIKVTKTKEYNTKNSKDFHLYRLKDKIKNKIIENIKYNIYQHILQFESCILDNQLKSQTFLLKK